MKLGQMVVVFIVKAQQESILFIICIWKGEEHRYDNLVPQMLLYS